MPLDVINRRHPGTLCQAEVVYQYGIAHIHAIKRVAAQGWHFDARLGGINGETRVEHGGSPTGLLPLHRPTFRNLEGGLPIYFRHWREFFTILVRTLLKLHALRGKPLNCIENSPKSVKMVKTYRPVRMARRKRCQVRRDLMWVNPVRFCFIGISINEALACSGGNGLGQLPQKCLKF